MMKWCLVAAGLKDLSRPAEKLSVPQNLGMLSSIYSCRFIEQRLTVSLLLSSRCDWCDLGSMVINHYSCKLQFGSGAWICTTVL